jgi:hypothetical protein
MKLDLQEKQGIKIVMPLGIHLSIITEDIWRICSKGKQSNSSQ